MQKIGILTSGGDSPGMNAAIRAATRYCIYNQIKVVGIEEGFKGLMEGQIKDLNLSSVGDIIHRGGTKLRSSRSDEFKTEEGQKKAINIMKIFEIDGLIIIGGDGSLKGAEKLGKKGIPVVGIPGTIDNDMGYTDFTIGFDTVLNTIVEAIGKIRDTTESHGRVSLIEVMGRDSGQIALNSGIAGGADCILIPEVDPNINKIYKKLINAKNRGKRHSIIVFSEGVKSFSIYELGDMINENTGIETRTTILGHLQRGGSPSAFDRVIASRFGAEAAKLLLQKKYNRIVGIKGNKILNEDIIEGLKIENDMQFDLLELGDILSI